AFAFDRERRFATAAELRRVLEAEPLEAVPAAYLSPRVSQLADLPHAPTQSTPRPDPRSGPKTQEPRMLPASAEAPLELDRAAPAPAPPTDPTRPRRGMTIAITVAGMVVVLGAFAAARTFIARATPPPAPADVTVRIIGLPHSAGVRAFLDGAPTATTFTMHGDREQHRVRLHADGYDDKGLVFVPDADQTLDGHMSRTH
ncbi:MAG TPA: hypothetical protein VGL86_28645, partial [Polyangia bacterium]